MARELGPKNIHVVHLLIDAGVDSEAIHQRMKAAKGIEARAVDVQVQVAPGIPAFNVVGLPDKEKFSPCRAMLTSSAASICFKFSSSAPHRLARRWLSTGVNEIVTGWDFKI